MAGNKIRHTTEWLPFSTLRKIENNISSLGYKKEYIQEHGLEEIKHYHCSNMITGVMNFFEPLEVKADGDEVFWRLNENHVHMDEPETFDTQFGVFNNHNNGEFTSWLGKDGYDGLPAKEKVINAAYGRNDFLVEGNYVDMFDCGKYAFAISNQMHMGLGIFKIIRIDEHMSVETMYDNYHDVGKTRLEYAGRFRRENNWFVIAGGSLEIETEEGEKRKFQDRAVLFRIDDKGNCEIDREWEIRISSANSMTVVGDYAYFGQNKMVTRLNLMSGHMDFFTNKNDEELAALTEIW